MEPNEVIEATESQPEVKQPSIWHRVTPFSKYAAMLLFIALPFIGGYVGYHYAPEKVVEVEIIEYRDAPIEISTTGITSGTPPASAATANYCVRVNSENLYNIYSSVRYQLAVKYPEYNFGVGVLEGYECLLESGSYLAIIPSVRSVFIVEYDNQGTITHTSPPYDIQISSIFIKEIRPQYINSLEFVTQVIDPCYHALHYYRYDLETKELSENMFGGEQGTECWNAFNAATGGV